MLKAISALFVVKVEGSQITVSKGKVPEYFIQEIKQVSSIAQAFQGKIYGMPRKGFAQLEFSRSVPETMQQRLRNVWRHTPIKSNKAALAVASV